MWLSAERVARDGYRALMKNEPVCIPGMQYRLVTTLARLLPLNLAYRLGRLRSRLLAKNESRI
jgi:short-subunit dehydrogenase